MPDVAWCFYKLGWKERQLWSASCQQSSGMLFVYVSNFLPTPVTVLMSQSLIDPRTSMASGSLHPMGPITATSTCHTCSPPSLVPCRHA